jgi:cytochrome c-type biogenesis protein CcmH
MTFWLVIGAMTAAAVLAVLVPLLRPRAADSARADHDLEVYRDQLGELDRDLERGLVGADEAAAAQLEIERRMLAAADAGAAAVPRTGVSHPGTAQKAMAVVLAVALPAGAAALYLLLGQPGLPDRPLAERRNQAAPVATAAEDAASRDLAEMAARVARRLREQPEDLDGWVLLARTYQNLGRHADAANAYGSAVAVAGDQARLHADHGEALVYAADGVMTPAARRAFEKAAKIDPADPKTRFYLAVAVAQAGRFQEAIDAWRKLAAEAAPDAPWLAAVRERIQHTASENGLDAAEALADLPLPVAATAAPGPDAADMAAAAEMPPEDRQAMIRGMVERLADRLDAEPNDVDGWLQLIRSYGVLGQPDRARAAEARAIAANASAAERIRTAVRGFGLAAAPDAAAAPGPSAAQVAAAQDMSPEARNRMIAGMVERLAGRLVEQPDDLDGWVRLARAYGTLGRRGDEAEALGQAARLAPDRVDVRVLRARALSALSSNPPPPGAVTEMRAVLALQPDNLEALWVVGLGEERANNRTAATDLFRRVLSLLPADAPNRSMVEQRLDALAE